MNMRFAALGLCVLLGCGPQSNPSNIPDFDPGFLPSDLSTTKLDRCAVSVGADPSWTSSNSSSELADGRILHRYQFGVGKEYRGRDPRHPSQVTINPHLSVLWSCNESKLGKKSHGVMVQSLHQQSLAKPVERWGGIQTFDAPGIGQVSYYVGSRATNSLTDMAHAYTQYLGKDLSVFIQIGRTSRLEGDYELFPAGSEQVFIDDPDYNFRVTRDSAQGPDGTIGYLRTEAENRALIESVIRSITAL